MNRRRLVTGLAGVAALALSQRATVATSESTPVAASCDLDLDASDLTLQVRIPSTVDSELLPGVTNTLGARLWAAGWESCSVSGDARALLVNVQLPETADRNHVERVATLLTVPGRVDFVDGGEKHHEVGSRIVTTSQPQPANGPDINVVYQTILTNVDILSVTSAESPTGDLVARFTLTNQASGRLASFTRDNVGSEMPLVIDGEVVISPIIQTEISNEIDLTPVEQDLVERLAILAAAAPYPEALTLVSIRDNRSAPTS